MQLLCRAGSPHQHVAITVVILEREGNRNTQRKILTAQKRSTIDTQLANERSTPDLVSVVRGTMHYRGAQFSPDRRGADFSRGMHWCATRELIGLRSSSVTVVS